jgi:hypothetical protein
MALNLNEFDQGVSYWRRRKDWPPDFHDNDYSTLETQNPHGHFDEAWWGTTLKRLKDWIALRPKSDEYITQRVRERFDSLGQTWIASVEPHLGQDIETVGWDQMSPFPSLVAEIKNVGSPVFTSKFCHFLAPRIFPVTDNEAMGLPRFSYQAHYELVQAEWAAADDALRDRLKTRMVTEVGTHPSEAFPTVNKIVELCLIGRCQSRRRASKPS